MYLCRQLWYNVTMKTTNSSNIKIMKLTKQVNELAELLREAIAELSEYRTGTEDDVDIVKYASAVLKSLGK